MRVLGDGRVPGACQRVRDRSLQARSAVADESRHSDRGKRASRIDPARSTLPPTPTQPPHASGRWPSQARVPPPTGASTHTKQPQRSLVESCAQRQPDPGNTAPMTGHAHQHGRRRARRRRARPTTASSLAVVDPAGSTRRAGCCGQTPAGARRANASNARAGVAGAPPRPRRQC